jgi:hypothetical protein
VRRPPRILFAACVLLETGGSGAAIRHRVPAFEPTDLDLADPSTLELDMQFGAMRRDSEPDLRLFVPDFEIDFGLTERVELDVDGAFSFDRDAGRYQLGADNLWVGTKLGLYADSDPLDPERAWAFGAQLGPRLPTAPHSYGTGFGAVLLGARMDAPWHVILNLGGFAEPPDRTEKLRSSALVAGIDLDYDLDVKNRWSILAELGAGYSFGPDPHDVHTTLGIDFNATPRLDLSLVGFYGFIPGGDRLGLFFGITPDFGPNPEAS